jgi:hypothetical protein
MTTYSLCKARYADRGSWRYGTIDAAIFDAVTESIFLYSVVYSNGDFSEIQVFPCVPPEEAPEWIPRSFEGLKAAFKEKAAHLTEAMETVCVERLSFPEVAATIKEDLQGTPKDVQRTVLAGFRACFAMAEGPRRRRP